MSAPSETTATSKKMSILDSFGRFVMPAVVGAIITIVVIMLLPRVYSPWSEPGPCDGGKQVRTRTAKGLSSKPVTIADLQETLVCSKTEYSDWEYESCDAVGKKRGTRKILKAATGTHEADSVLTEIMEDCQNDVYFSNKHHQEQGRAVSLFTDLNFSEGSELSPSLGHEDTYQIIDGTGRITALSMKAPKNTKISIYRKLTDVTLPTITNGTSNSATGDLNVTWDGTKWTQDEGAELWKSAVHTDNLIFEHVLTENVPDLLRYLISIPEFQKLKYRHPILDGHGAEVKQVQTTELVLEAQIHDALTMLHDVNASLVQPTTMKVHIPASAADLTEGEPRPEMRTFGYGDTGSVMPTLQDMAVFEPSTVKDSETWEQLVNAGDEDFNPSALLVPSENSRVVVIRNGKVAASYGTFFRKTAVTAYWLDHHTLQWHSLKFDVDPTSTPFSEDFANTGLELVKNADPDFLDGDILMSFKSYDME